MGGKGMPLVLALALISTPYAVYVCKYVCRNELYLCHTYRLHCVRDPKVFWVLALKIVGSLLSFPLLLEVLQIFSAFCKKLFIFLFYAALENGYKFNYKICILLLVD